MLRCERCQRESIASVINEHWFKDSVLLVRLFASLVRLVNTSVPTNKLTELVAQRCKYIQYCRCGQAAAGGGGAR